MSTRGQVGEVFANQWVRCGRLGSVRDLTGACGVCGVLEPLARNVGREGAGCMPHGDPVGVEGGG